MKKTKIFLLGILVFSLFSFVPVRRVSANYYNLGATVGFSKTYDYIGFMSARISIQVTEIHDETDVWNVTLLVSASMMGTETYNQTIVKNASQATEGLNFIANPDFLCPLPVPSYLYNMCLALGPDWNVTGCTIIYNATTTIYKTTYDDVTGHVIYAVALVDDEIVSEFTLYEPSDGEPEPEIPGYTLPIVLGAIISISIITYRKRKRKIEIET